VGNQQESSREGGHRGASPPPQAGEPQAAGGGADTSPSNTVSDNSKWITPWSFVPLRWGVDSLYLSYRGRLFDATEEALYSLKTAAQSDKPGDVARAQLKLGEHVFEVKDKGSGLFPFVLEDNAFRISLSRTWAKSLPMAYVKISSHFLSASSPAAIEAELRAILEAIGTVEGPPGVSRIDLFVDFISSIDMEGWDRRAWVTRARSINAYAVDDLFSGWAIGLGGPIAARLYDKVLELKKSGKDWLRPLWLAAGWNGEDRVWRLEFELKREVVSQLGLQGLDAVLAALGGLWSYAMTEWLRLTLPSPTDTTRTRWPVHPLWAALAGVDWECDGMPLARTFAPDRAPSHKWVLQQMLGLLYSHMAIRGVSDYGQGKEQLLRELDSFLGERAEWEGAASDALVREQVALRVRRFNLALNVDEIPNEDRLRTTYDERANDATEYRRRSRGS